MTLAEIVVTAGGALLSAGLVWVFFGPKASGEAVMRGGVQEVEVTVRGGYSPAIVHVRRGSPLRLVFDRQERRECTSEVVFPDFRILEERFARGEIDADEFNDRRASLRRDR